MRQNTAKVEMEVNEMMDADVHFISMVKRGANRIPFRILKSEGGSMLDLGKLFKTKKAEEARPTVAAVVVSKDLDAAKVVSALEAKGVVVAKVDADTHEAATLVILDESADLTMAQAFKSSDNVAMLVSNVKKGFCSYADSSDFLTNVSTNGFFPGVYQSMESLENCIRNIMWESDAAPDLAAIGKAFDDAKAYVLELAAAVPQLAFKMEEALADESVMKLDVSEAAPAEALTEKSEEAPPEEQPAETLEAQAAPVEEAPAAEPQVGGEPVVKSEEDPLQVLMQKMEQMLVAIKEENAEAVAGMVSKVDALAGKLEGVETLAKKTEEAIAGVVHAEPAADAQTTSVKKTDKQLGTFDSAFKFPGIDD